EGADRTGRPVAEPVRRTDERQVVQAGPLELLADARERAARIAAAREHVQQRRALLQRLHQAAERTDLLRTHLVEQGCRAADEELPVLVRRLLERAAEHEQ